MHHILQTTQMPAWRGKVAAGAVCASLLGCAISPSDFGKLAATTPAPVPVAAPLSGHYSAPAENKSETRSQTATPSDVARSPSGGGAAAGIGIGVAAEPNATASPQTQRGRTSWYGKKFNGRRTASGERFDAMALTAAHRTLPLQSYVRVRVVGSGKEVVVRINDRGPFHSRRVLDVSYAAARQLGIVGRGTALVDIFPLAAEEVPANADVKDATQ